MTVAVVLVAAGSGTRLGRRQPKALVLLGGEPLVAHAARALVAGASGDGERASLLVVTAPAEHVTEVAAAVTRAVPGMPFMVVPGRSTRQGSVAAALDALAPHPDIDVVLVHDAARPQAPPALVGRVIQAVRGGHAAVVPGLPVVDTIKRVALPAHVPDAEAVSATPGTGWPVTATVPREELRAVQTPQGFERALLERAHAAAAGRAADDAVAASDDAGLVELLGEPVWVVPGDERAAKITTERDLVLAEAMLGRQI